MPLDKFGRNGYSLYWNKYNKFNKYFLRRDGGNTAIGAIDINSRMITTVRIRCQIKMLQPRIIDKNAITTAGGVVSGDIKLNVFF